MGFSFAFFGKLPVQKSSDENQEHLGHRQAGNAALELLAAIHQFGTHHRRQTATDHRHGTSLWLWAKNVPLSPDAGNGFILSQIKELSALPE